MIDEFPVWNSEPDQPAMMSWASVLEREKVSEIHFEIWCVDDRSSLFSREMEGAGAVWVVFTRRVNLSPSNIKQATMYMKVLIFPSI